MNHHPTMNDGGYRGDRDMENCIEVSYEEYDFGNFTASATIHLETCASDRASSKRSSKKSTSTIRRQRRRRQQQVWWLLDMEEDSSYVPFGHYRQHAGKSRPAPLKTPFTAGRAGNPYNKKLRKKSMQKQQQQPATTVSNRMPVDVDAKGGSDFYISPAHRAVAENSAPWSQSACGQASSGAVHFQFLGHGGISEPTAASGPHYRDVMPNGQQQNNWRTRGTGDVNVYSGEDNLRQTTCGNRLDVPPVCGGSKPLTPMPTPPLLPPLSLLPASRTDVCSDLLEQYFLDVNLDDDAFS
uniref:Uncharacterized protein n=1 Tax=Trypanosoma congolense (strain IL3000) TaxID=1068625 RepID=G0UJC9_TRYCI|nr:conserved hypothetical protein [Trypanosoma congolense IL3000]